MRIPRRKPIYPFGDNDALYFGTSNDVGMYWDGTDLIFNPALATGTNITFSFGNDVNTILGGTAGTSDLILGANTDWAYPRIYLYGSSNIELQSVADVIFKEQTTQMIKLSYAANVSTIHGGAVAGDDLELEANTAEAGAAIILEGLGDVALNPAAGSYVKFGTHVGTGDVGSNGHIIIEDIGGTQRKLMTTA